jgi:hypothetical protein
LSLARCSTLLLTAACAPILAPRSAELLPPGKLGGAVATEVAGYGMARTTLETRRGVEQVARGNAAGAIADPQSPLALMAYAYASITEARLAIGLPRVEVGAMYGWARLGLEARFAALDETRAAPLSVAPAVAGGLSPWEGTAWGRAGLDASKRIRGRKELLLGAHVFTGDRRQIHRLGRAWGTPLLCFEGYPGPCWGRDPHTIGRAVATHHLTALALPLGVQWAADGTGFTFGAVASVPLRHTPREAPVCSGCRPDLEVLRVEPGPVIDATITLTFGPDRGRW